MYVFYALLNPILCIMHASDIPFIAVERPSELSRSDLSSTSKILLQAAQRLSGVHSRLRSVHLRRIVGSRMDNGWIMDGWLGTGVWGFLHEAASRRLSFVDGCRTTALSS